MVFARKLAQRLGFAEAVAHGETGTVPTHPFGTSPHADRETYLSLHREASAASYPEIDAIEAALGFAIDRAWMEELALHTQVVIKKSRLNYQHGRMLYAHLRHYCATSQERYVTVLETGTARGFSSLCMAKALDDAKVDGHLVTVDLLPHNRRFLWNCIDDNDGPKTRQELLQAYEDLLRRVVFVEGPTRRQLDRLGLKRVNFAFLDACHTCDDVMAEYAYARDRQKSGDVVVFDDVTPAMFDGVVEAIAAIESEGLYSIERIQPSDQRGYAIAVRR
jgi:predicted O-methyltransferase YrrM